MLPPPAGEEKTAYGRFDEFIQEGKVKELIVGADFIIETVEEPDGTPGKSKHFKIVRAEILQGQEKQKGSEEGSMSLQRGMERGR